MAVTADERALLVAGLIQGVCLRHCLALACTLEPAPKGGGWSWPASRWAQLIKAARIEVYATVRIAA